MTCSLFLLVFWGCLPLTSDCVCVCCVCVHAHRGQLREMLVNMGMLKDVEMDEVWLYTMLGCKIDKAF